MNMPEYNYFNNISQKEGKVMYISVVCVCCRPRLGVCSLP